MTDGEERARIGAHGFGLRTTADGKVFITWRGRTVMTLKGNRAIALRARLADLDEDGRQLALAKITGNFKRGTEKGR